MALDVTLLQSKGYEARTRATSGNECKICGRQTFGLDGACFVMIDHTTNEYVNDEEAAQRGQDCSYYPLGPECLKKWRKAVPNATPVPLKRSDFVCQP